MQLESDHIILRPMEQSDVNLFHPITSNPAFWTWFTADLSVEDELEGWVNAALEQAHKGERIPFTILEKISGRVAGSSSLGSISQRDGRIEIGWTWLGKEFQGTGINDQSKYLLLKYSFEELKMERVEFKTDVLNQLARRALRRIGATEEGVLRSHTLMTHGRRRDTIYYSILKNEWDAIRIRFEQNKPEGF